MKKNNVLLYAILGGVVTCFICIGMVFLFPSNGNNDLKGNTSIDLNQSGYNDLDDEISLGDTCNTCSSYGSWNCTANSGTQYGTPTGCTTTEPSSGTSWTKCVIDGSNSSGPIYHTESCTRTCTSYTCTACDAGKYLENGNCQKCPKGYYCPGGSEKITCGSTEYQDEDGQSACKTCNKGQNGVPNPGPTKCETTAVEVIQGSSGGIRYTLKGEGTPKFTYTAINNTYGVFPQVNWSVSSGFDAEISDYEARVGGSAGAAGDTGTGCKMYRLQLTASNGVSSVTHSGESFCVYCRSEWATTKGSWRLDTGPELSSASSTRGCRFFSKASNGLYYDTAYNRCCYDSPPPSNYGYCYGDEPYIGIATKTKWVSGNSAPSGYPFKYDHSIVDNKDECNKMEAKSCNATPPQTDTKNLTTSECETDVPVEISKYKIDCSGDGNFYSITCSQKVNTNFDYGADDSKITNNNLYAGQGFKYKVTLTTKVTCQAVFHPEVWQAAYDRVMDKMKKVQSTSKGGQTAYDVYRQNNSDKYMQFKDYLLKVDEHTSNTDSYLFELYTKAKEIEGLIAAYNNYKLEENYKEEVSLEMNHIKTVDNSNKMKFIKLQEDNGKTSKKITKRHSLGISWVENPTDYEWTMTRNVEFVPEKTYLDTSVGDVNYKNSGTLIDGGNKVYIDYDIKSDTKIPMKISVSGIGGESSKSTIVNEKCSVVVKDYDIKYRSVDVTNPFINSKWEKGENWVNNMYDFTKTIHANTWSTSPVTTIELSKEQVSALQSSTARLLRDNYSPYLGVCDSINSKSQDAITKTICNKINNSFK